MNPVFSVLILWTKFFPIDLIMACTLPTWAINQHGKKIEECNFQCVNQQQGERGLARYPLDAKERQIFKFSGLYSRI